MQFNTAANLARTNNPSFFTKGGGLLSFAGGPLGAVGLGLSAVGLLKDIFSKDPYEEYRKNIKKMMNELPGAEAAKIESLKLTQSQSLSETQRRIEDVTAASGLPKSLATQNIWRTRMTGERNLLSAMATLKDYTLRQKMQLLQMSGQIPPDTSGSDLLSTGLQLFSMNKMLKGQ
jgi:hypothetical protein